MMDRSVVILCGGRGKRLGSVADEKPKSLAVVHGQPIIWYIIMRLHEAGFRHFILPLGYRGDQIQGYIDRHLTALDARVDSLQTGEDTEIGRRIHRVSHLIQSESFLLVNGDTLFDFDIKSAFEAHESSRAAVTLTSCQVLSQYGLLIAEGDRIVDFTRDSLVASFMTVDRVDPSVQRSGYINAGITILAKKALAEINLQATVNFEQELFARLVVQGRARHHPIDGFWFAVDTQKDLEVANAQGAGDPRSAGAFRLHQRLLRYAATTGLGQ